MPERIPQSATIRVPLQAYLSSDHVSPATGKTLAITISKDGAAYGNPSGGATNATEIASGSYYVDLSTTDTGTVGPLFILGTAASTDAVVAIYDVVKATNGGFTALPDTACTTNASLITAGTGTAQLTTSAGGVTLADGVAHGGTPGSGTATLALASANLHNASGTALTLNGSNRSIDAFGAVQIQGNADQSALSLFGGTGDYTNGFYIGTASINGSALEIDAGPNGPAIEIEGPATGSVNTDFGSVMPAIHITGSSVAGDGIQISTTVGHGISILAAGSGKKALLLAGPAATDALATAAGAGSPIDVFDAAGAVRLPAIATDWISAAGVSAAAVTKIQTGLATPTNITAGTIATVTNPVTIDKTMVLSAARDVSAVADTSLTLNDALHCAIGAAAGKETVVGTAYTVKTPSTGTTLRIFTLDSSTAPTSRT